MEWSLIDYIEEAQRLFLHERSYELFYLYESGWRVGEY
jgi:hypothetical protein